MTVTTRSTMYWYRRVGDRIHKTQCRYAYAKTSVPWHYADGMLPSTVRKAVASAPWLSLCKRCWREVVDG